MSETALLNESVAVAKESLDDLAQRVGSMIERNEQLEAQVAALTKQRDELRKACEAWREVFTDAEGAEVSFTAVVVKQVNAMNLTLAALANTEEANPKGGIAAIFGKWPGDETDAEIDAVLNDTEEA